MEEFLCLFDRVTLGAWKLKCVVLFRGHQGVVPISASAGNVTGMSIHRAHTPLMCFSWLRKGYWILVRSCHSLEVKMKIEFDAVSFRDYLVPQSFLNICVSWVLIYHPNSTQHWGAVHEGRGHPATSIGVMVQTSIGFRETFHYLRTQWRNETAARYKKQKVKTQRSQQLDYLFQLLLTEEPLFGRAEVFLYPIWKKRSKFKAKGKIIGLNISKIFTKGMSELGCNFLTVTCTPVLSHSFCLFLFITCHNETKPPYTNQKMCVRKWWFPSKRDFYHVFFILFSLVMHFPSTLLCVCFQLC